VPQGCRFEAVASDVSGWLSTEAAHRASRVFAAAGGRHLPATAFAGFCLPESVALLADLMRCDQGRTSVVVSEGCSRGQLAAVLQQQH